MSFARIPTVLLLVLVLAVAAACGDGEEPPEETAFQINAQISVTLPPVLRIGDPFCRNGEEPFALSAQVCEQPVEYSCVTYYCPDPGGGPAQLADIAGGGPNPVCVKAALQAKPCSNEQALPSRERWVEILPQLFGKELLEAPLVE